MFGNKAKHALAAAQAENAQLKAQADTLQGELAATQARLAQLETQAQQSAMRQMLLDGVVGNLPRFGESLSGFRLSFSGLSEQLSDDAAMVHTAASESDANRAAFEKIAGNLHAMFERISVAGNSVEGLSRSAGEIGGIVQLIKEIAEQTNLLALNAAIEAARAGEQGRGFAVVADEVRNLAARTANSTREISEMVKSIQQGTAGAVEGMERGVERVNAGVARAEKAGEAMARIRQAAEQVQATVAEISHALREQSSASTEIAQQVEMIARMAEENGLAVASNHQTAASLGTLADTLLGNVGRFRT